MVYVALLRGINVGGKNKIDMKQLKKVFEDTGLKAVVTYINSGNIIFNDAEHTKTELKALIEQAINTAFHLDIKVLIRSLSDFDLMMESLPESWNNDEEMKGDVLFLEDEIDNEKLQAGLAAIPRIDTVIFTPGAILWSVARENVTRSGLMKVAGSSLYKSMTVRNVNTARKLYEIMRAQI